MQGKIILGTVILACLLVTIYVTRPIGRISRQAFSRIQIGMGESEVEAALGFPDKDYGTHKLLIKFDTWVPIDCVHDYFDVMNKTSDTQAFVWASVDGAIIVYFDAHNLVSGTDIREVSFKTSIVDCFKQG